MAAKGLALVGTLATGESTAAAAVASAMAIPGILYIATPSSFCASAKRPKVVTSGHSSDFGDDYTKTQLEARVGVKGLFSLYHPLNLAKILLKNIGLSLLIKLNGYAMELLEHERLCLEADERGQRSPPSPPIPDFKPSLSHGLYGFYRELAIASVRKIYETIAVYRLPTAQSEPLLRDARLYARDVLALTNNTAPVAKKFASYFNTVLQATVLFSAADCTVSIAYHTHYTLKRSTQSRRKKLRYWLKGVGCHVARCSATLCIVSTGAALGSLIQPGNGTLFGLLLSDLLASNAIYTVITLVLAEDTQGADTHGAQAPAVQPAPA